MKENKWAKESKSECGRSNEDSGRETNERKRSGGHLCREKTGDNFAVRGHGEKGEVRVEKGGGQNDESQANKETCIRVWEERMGNMSKREQASIKKINPPYWEDNDTG